MLMWYWGCLSGSWLNGPEGRIFEFIPIVFIEKADKRHAESDGPEVFVHLRACCVRVRVLVRAREYLP